MHVSRFFYPALLAASGADALRSDKVKLSNIQSLTLRKGKLTSARRVDPIPQLKCIGGSARGLYEPEIMRCKNSGSDYDEDSIQWTCTASLPEEFKLGSTDVICEGYDYPEDPYILKGSCGVEYRLVLTDKGREKYGKGRGGWPGDDEDRPDGPKTMGEKIAGALFWMLFGGVVIWMIYSALRNRAEAQNGGLAGGNRPGWGGGGGGGGWGGGFNDDNNDPPPPYYPNDPRKSGYGTTQGWRPGFWSGAAGGAAAGWAAGQFANRGSRSNQDSGWGAGSGSGSSRWNNGGEGSSRSSSGDSYSSTRHESTGFGGTSRR
ncbi:uncharacterized protein yc1106_03119 [Curvularia clavata]|uniref:Store-operated calcium entry-associated regulatory factor n=1 Tax=Curvularia clavata TaxID=95742 RepID=A0A9Q8Z651_CURCL|nr:uncharacterized protein yc1106_03119 [Curvularia clavata]